MKGERRWEHEHDVVDKMNKRERERREKWEGETDIYPFKYFR